MTRAIDRLQREYLTPAAAEGFARAELMAMLTDEPLYRACGYVEIERTAAMDGVDVPPVWMAKRLHAR